MRLAIIQIWEESFNDNSISPDGCTLHIDKGYRNKYVENFYNNRTEEIPDTYERIVGTESFVKISEELWDLLSINKNIRITEVEFNNLLGFKKIQPA